MNLLRILSFSLLAGMASSSVLAAAENEHVYEGFQSIESVEVLMDLPTTKLCSNGGPSSAEIDLILLNVPLTLSMYSNDPTTARLIISEQSKKIKANIKEKCSATNKNQRRWESIKILKSKSEREVCEIGPPTKEEFTVLMENDKEFNTMLNEAIDKINKSDPKTRLLMEEGAKLKGMSLRGLMTSDIATQTAKNWKDSCNKQSPEKNTIDTNDTSKITNDLQERYADVELKINNLWKSLSGDTRKKLLSSQRKWIKTKDSVCKTDLKCLIDITNERITQLEDQR